MEYRLLDYSVNITASDPEASAAVHAMLQGFPADSCADSESRYALVRDPDAGWCVDVRGTRTVRGAELADAVIALEWQIVSDLLARPSDWFQLHGAALATPSGRGSVLILGASGAGKTTLTLALMARGLLPLTDDLIFLDSQTLEPAVFQRAFHVDGTTHRLVAALSPPPAWRVNGLPPGYGMPAHWAEARPPVCAVFFPTVHVDEAPSATKLSVADAAVTLLPFSATLDRSPELALAAAARLTGRASCYALRSGGLTATAALVVALAMPSDCAP